MHKEMYRVITKVYPTNMDVFYDDDRQEHCWYTISRDEVEGCDNYEEFRATIFDIIEEQTGYKLEEHEKTLIDMDIQIWSNYFSKI